MRGRNCHYHDRCTGGRRVPVECTLDHLRCGTYVGWEKKRMRMSSWSDAPSSLTVQNSGQMQNVFKYMHFWSQHKRKRGQSGNFARLYFWFPQLCICTQRASIKSSVSGVTWGTRAKFKCGKAVDRTGLTSSLKSKSNTGWLIALFFNCEGICGQINDLMITEWRQIEN